MMMNLKKSRKKPHFFSLFNPILYGGGKFTPTKVILFAPFQAAYGVENPQNYVNQLCLRRFCQIFSLFEAFSKELSYT